MNELEGSENVEITHPSLQQLTIHTLISQRRMAIIKFPYSDLKSLPSQVSITKLSNRAIQGPSSIGSLG